MLRIVAGRKARAAATLARSRPSKRTHGPKGFDPRRVSERKGLLRSGTDFKWGGEQRQGPYQPGTLGGQREPYNAAQRFSPEMDFRRAQVFGYAVKIIDLLLDVDARLQIEILRRFTQTA